MASNCYNIWVKAVNSKGLTKWINKGPAPDGACPSCPTSNFPAAGTWNGYSAACQGGAIVKYVADGSGGIMPGGVIHAAGTPQAKQACSQLSDNYIGTGPITNYF